MKVAITILLTLFFTSVYCQDNFKSLIDSAKAEFSKEFEQQDYKKAVDYLEKAVSLKPDDAEAHYFLGYAYSRVNAKDGKDLLATSLPLTIKASEQFELVNKLTPKYDGEIVVLDPYSKISFEWASLAISYLFANNQDSDSAKWAFEEGKRRGGFGDFTLAINRVALDACSENAMLVSSGDNPTLVLWYLQCVEGYRPDVSVIDINLLDTKWYPEYLSQKEEVPSDFLTIANDTVYYYGNIPRHTMLLLHLMRLNRFKRGIYYTYGFPKEEKESFDNRIDSYFVVDKLELTDSKPDINQYNKEVTDIFKLSKYVNLNSTDELNLFNYFRYILVSNITDNLSDDKKRARELLKLFDKYANDAVIPYYDDRIKAWISNIRESTK